MEEPAVPCEAGAETSLNLASCVSRDVLPKNFLNKTDIPAVFMIEVKRLFAGEAVLSEDITVPCSQDGGHERSRDRSQDEVLEDLVRQYSRLVYRIAYAALRSHHDAEDATQETFLRVLRYSRKLATVENPKTWLARIAWRVAVDRSRRRGRKQEIALEDPASSAEEARSSDIPADHAMQRSQESARLERLIAALPKQLREPLILSAVEEMAPREVAAALGINESAVRSRVFRARKILKEKLAAPVEARTS